MPLYRNRQDPGEIVRAIPGRSEDQRMSASEAWEQITDEKLDELRGDRTEARRRPRRQG